MSGWWTYALSDFLLFSPQTYYRLFELHNAALWPLHVLLLAGGLLILLWLRGRDLWHGRAIAAALAGLLLFVAWIYLVERYAPINWAAPYFAGAFAVEALLLLTTGLALGRINVPANAKAADRLGIAIFIFALVFYPLIAPLMGRSFLQAEFFGIAPDPTVAATLGVLLVAERTHWHLLIIPLLWCVVTGLTQIAMESPDALVMPVTGGLSIAVATWKTWGRST